MPELLVDVHAHGRARQRLHKVFPVQGPSRPAGPPRHQPEIGELAQDGLAHVVAGPHKHERRRPARVRRQRGRGRGRPQVFGVAAKREIVGPRARRAVARETGAVVGEEAVVRRRELRGQVQPMGVVGEPVDPAAAEPPLEVPDLRRGEARPLEDEHDVDGPPPQVGGKPGGEGASENGVPAAAPLLAAPHLTPQRRKRGGQGQTAPVVATVERRDQHDAQTRERRGARRHTST